MKLGRPLARRFYDRPCLAVAPDLVGAYLVRRLSDGTRLVGRLVEVEAYLGDGSDPGSHSHRGPTPRNRSMFGPPGRFYTYRIYGIHVCLNLVCEARDSGAAILLRAVEPLEGADRMRRHRGLEKQASPLSLARGPARLVQAFDLGMDVDGQSALRGSLTVHARPPGDGIEIASGPRIGVPRAPDLPYRFFVPRCRFVSGPRTP